jgi:hypothetical protein
LLVQDGVFKNQAELDAYHTSQMQKSVISNFRTYGNGEMDLDDDRAMLAFICEVYFWIYEFEFAY